MPWMEISPMEERQKFVEAVLAREFSMTELCAQFGISRKTGYKWRARFWSNGPAGLAELSRAPHHQPHKIPPDVAEAVLDARRQHPTWGPLKLLPWLGRRRPELVLPAPSTVGDLLARHGLVAPGSNRRRRPGSRQSAQLTQPCVANHVWAIDFKGQFRTGDGLYCYPLTVTDLHSRYVLVCQGFGSTRGQGVRTALEQLFREVGLPEALRSDNGSPFCSRGLLGLSKLSVWWTQLGIRHERIVPGRPDQNGSHERMHRTLKAETARPPAANHKAQQKRFDRFRHEFNEERPHQALGRLPPAMEWNPSVRKYPERLDNPEYPGHFELRRVRRNGVIKFKNRLVFVSETLAHRSVGLEEVDDGLWSLYYGRLLLARYDETTHQLHPAGGMTWRN